MNTGDFSFKTTFVGRYRIICDLDDDGNFETTGGDDLVLTGDASASGPMGTIVNEVTWDGQDNAGANVSAGDYDCMATVSVGEFHYVARDMEVGFEGIRMFSVGPGPANARTGINMFWNDTDIFPAVPIAMNNGTFPAPTSPAIGLAPGNDPNAAAVPYGLDSMSMTVAGNSRGWGSFLDPCPAMGSCSTNGNGDIGDDDYMDTWASFASAGSTSLSVAVLGSGANCDGDSRSDQQEACIDGTNPCGCTDAGTATPSSPDTECSMAVPACSITMGVGSCVACDEGCVMGSTQVCDDTSTPKCVPCYDDSMGSDDSCGGSGAALSVCKVDSMNTANSACVECVADSECSMGEVCNSTTNECAEGVCDTAGGECVTCLDSGSGIDSGCSGATPVCEDVSGVLTCVAGTTNFGGGISGGALCAFSGAPANGLPLGVALACLVWGWTRRRGR